MSSRPTPEQLQRLLKLGAATVHEAQGRKGAMDSGLKPLDPARRLVGVALTVDCAPADNLIIHYALTQARPGDVLVVDAKGFLEAGAWGDLLTLAAQRSGIAGLVIDGAVRDADAIIGAGFPVFARGLSIKGTEKKQPGKVNVPILCGGVLVRAGDVVLGDRDGLVVVAQDELEEAIRLSEQREDKEDGMRAKIKGGQSTLELLDLAPVLRSLGIGSE